ncbi:sigma-54-dependent Fis family transcriptional regulator [Thiohalocapsa halophila]|uniref:Sigma-54-dependent Fis family transcriptional regulator n=1 Tax=Thiohalocapsa halophila TaxID=69359 RepID=A0ABS1CJY6_9GAMM|nr:sigma-54 dependent transcriptional regulator [Thiohalocapsa halophila]MBK1632215.1 sigma-54-dependent Fis family transcriptional regulator [Thiohalocapsa halophila]
MQKTHLLIIEDDAALAEMLALHFEDQGATVETAGDCTAGLAAVSAGHFDVALLDQHLPDGDGIELLPKLLETAPALIVVMMTGQHDLELAIDAMHQGAADFVHKPVQTDQLEATIGRLLSQRREAATAPSPTPPAPQRDLIGRSAAMLEVSKAIATAARGAATVLITGESGTGKEVVARLIHEHSGAPGPFVAVNCAALVDTLLESELFGHERGAFTGANARKPGRFEQASDGTLFLDEVGELAAPLQAKLLRAIQEKAFERVGGTETLTSNARIVAATNRDLMAEAAAGRFREDLAYRLRVLEVRVPPLRERREDIPLLADGLLTRIAERLQVQRPRLTEDALARLGTYDWPGNVRELENLLTRVTLGARAGVATPDLLDLPDAGASTPGADSDDHAQVLRTLDEVEADHIQRVLLHTGGHKAHSCEILGISRPALDRKIAKYGLKSGKAEH